MRRLFTLTCTGKTFDMKGRKTMRVREAPYHCSYNVHSTRRLAATHDYLIALRERLIDAPRVGKGLQK